MKRNLEIKKWLAKGTESDKELRGRAQAYYFLHRELLGLREQAQKED